MKILENKKLSENQLREQNPQVLAFLGDALHTLFIRNYFVKNNNELTGKLHLRSAKLCKAVTQAKVLDRIISKLDQDESAIVKRTRNYKSSHIAKNTDLETYKKASSFEALLGYLYLKQDERRLKEILNESLIGDDIYVD